MREEIEDTVKVLVSKAASSKMADEAMKYSQSVLNLTHALRTLSDRDLSEGALTK